MNRDQLMPLQIELREVMQSWGCPLCRLAAKSEIAFIESLNYERVLDVKTRDALKASRGLCERHSRCWEDVQGSALGMAIVYRVTLLDLLRDTTPSKRAGAFPFGRKNATRSVVEQLSASGGCPACAVASGTAERFADLLLKDIRDPALQESFVSCGGLCLPHLRLGLLRPGPSSRHETLLNLQRESWKALMAELEEFIRKNDYRFVHEVISEAEGASWYRAVDAAVGLRHKRSA